MYFQIVTIITVTLLAFTTGAAFALEATDSAEKKQIPTLQQVTVVGKAEEPLTGSNTLERSQIDQLPAKNGSINEIITILPGVKPPEQGRSSTRGGEILPPNVSISGGAVYQNNFQIDGFSNNSLLDPMESDVTGSSVVPGHPQAIFLPTSLLEEIKVYRYNVPAAYGNFTGGVVDAAIVKPQADFFGEVRYRATTDEWTSFHIDDENYDEFKNSDSSANQPEFFKQEAGFLLNTPLAENLSLLTSYQINHAEIPLQHFNSRKDQTRKNETFLAKLAWDINETSSLVSTLNYSPYSGDYFYRYGKDSDFTIEGGGWQIDSTYEQHLQAGTLSLQGAIKGSRNERDAPQDFYQWLAVIDDELTSKPWGATVGTGLRSFEGSVGSLEKEQTGFELNAAFQAEPLRTGATTHHVSAGLQFEYVRGEVNRNQMHTQYNWNKKNANADIVCDDDDPTCVSGEQIFISRTIWPEESTSASIKLIDLYLEDTINWQRLQLRPGLRWSYDDFMANSNLAPRFAASYDLFGNGKTLLIGGWNRYYGKTLLTYKLREAGPDSDFQSRPVSCSDPADGPVVCTAGDWPDFAPGTRYRYSDAKTPYADETVLGFDQLLFDGRLKLTWVQRKGRDEYTRERTGRQDDGLRYYQLTNNGESQHDEYTLEWERSWQQHALAINATYQEATRSNESYQDIFYGDIYLVDQVWYDGDYIHRAELPREDFNRPWTANLIYTAKLPKGFSFTNVTSYRSGYEGLDRLSTAEKKALGVTTSIGYKKATFSSALTFDWKFVWDIPIYKGQTLTASLEINNVFDEKVEIGDGGTVVADDPHDYELGRQYWFGMTYKF